MATDSTEQRGWQLTPKIYLMCNVYTLCIAYVYMFLCGSVVDYCVSSAKGCGFDSQGTHILMKM